MLATRAAGRSDLPTGPDWVFEVKWDGVRALADTTRGPLHLLSRTGRDITVTYPELAGLAAVQGAVLDGEIVAMEAGVPSFEALAERMHVRDPTRAAALASRRPVAYLVFDVLELYGVDLTRRSFDDRRATLERLDLPAPAQLSPLYPDVDDLWEVTREHGLEGVLAKRRASTYQQGRRSPDWMKATHRTTRTALVGGWLPAAGSGVALGSLMLGAPDGDGRLRWLGRVGSGLAGPSGTLLAGRLASLARATTPFDDTIPAADTVGVRWCDPTVLVDITYMARTRAGRLRHPVVRGMREDVPADAWEVP
ncbi:MAG TPA: non-homologous end-joining DNA ligase [Cellulomonas sp.]|uniref:non-homologous end-joining DNA ligase n=1 Tax=Cellulomonas sp. TaxID=40001 RepID=UPI002E32CB07|nr:non-homologous end-joining DNA ligase [Cellulomonas sp.]HEX5332599.1 non-homologous end-joining DNA ligase [Cellulomonas sp.]